jgi:hypothetical protein
MKKQANLNQQIERAQNILSSWPPEKLAKMQLQGTDVYLERVRAAQAESTKNSSSRKLQSA